MNIKKLTALFLTILLFNVNIVYAQNWVTITAENGKSADLDLDSVKMAVDTVEYDIRIITEDYIYINRMSTELYKNNTPTAVILKNKYNIDGSELITTEKDQDREYRDLKPGTLQAEIFDVLSKQIDEKMFIKGKKTWSKYLKKQRKIITNDWNTSYIYFPARKDGTPMYRQIFEIRVDSEGYLIDPPSRFNKIKLDALPDDYTNDYFDLTVAVNYYKYAGKSIYTEKPYIAQTSPTSAEISIAKNSRPPVIGHIEFGILYTMDKNAAIIKKCIDNLNLINYVKFILYDYGR